MLEKKARILIVEDDEDDYVIAKDYLEELDEYIFKIDWVSTPNEALEKLKLNQHDICLLDYQLGAHNGLTVLLKATEMQCRVPIIMLTGQSDKVLDKAALDAGAVDFIVKSELDGPRFARAIRYAIARQEVQKERLERINVETQIRSKDRFLAHLSHELRTPLTSILGYTELLLDSDKAQPVCHELNIILNNGKHLLSLLNDVLDLSKIAAKKLELTPTTFNLNSFMADIYTLMQVAANDKGIELTLISTTALPEEIHCDPTRLRQVLINLIHNGIKFTDSGKVSVSVSAKLDNNQYTLFFEVVDTGKGIPAEAIDKIFQPFEQVEDTISRKETGSGLGLAISSELANKLGGGIAVKSTVGKGSCFTLSISCPNLAGTKLCYLSLHRKVTGEKNAATPPLSGRVLVVDDVADIRMLIGHTVKTFGLNVDFAENGKQAVEKTLSSIEKGDPYAAILMDIHMPEMDGKEAVVEIRKRGGKQPILALTAANMKGVKENLQTLGFDNLVSKPIDKMLLYKHLSLVINAKATTTSAPQEQANIEQMDQQAQYFMLVEDDVDAAQITQILLESLGVKVEVAHTAQACKEKLTSRKNWDKILVDVHLPDGNGLELAKYLSTQSRSTEIVIVSGAEIDKAAITGHGASRAILKPLNKEKLQELTH
ncbi:MAG: response regulator [Paraglaciecola sp.]|uniref:response regulator n=1 Tax=Paraglaciecola sp. TaxID=1920173 RepID=UPI003298142F